jgi:hypothetical protein
MFLCSYAFGSLANLISSQAPASRWTLSAASAEGANVWLTHLAASELNAMSAALNKDDLEKEKSHSLKWADGFTELNREKRQTNPNSIA